MPRRGVPGGVEILAAISALRLCRSCGDFSVPDETVGARAVPEFTAARSGFVPSRSVLRILPSPIHLMHYNFVRIHQTLRCTPAMAAGVSKTLWELADMVKVLEEWESAQ